MTSSRHLAIGLALAATLAATPAFANSQCDTRPLANQSEQLRYELRQLEDRARGFIEEEGNEQARLTLARAADTLKDARTSFVGTSADTYLGNTGRIVGGITEAGWQLGIATVTGGKPEYAELFSHTDSVLSWVLLHRKTLFDCYTAPPQ